MLLTTHYMAEAEELCDRLAIIDRGRVLACDSTPALRRRVQGGQHVELEVLSPAGVTLDPAAIAGVAAAWGAPHPERGTRTLKFRLPDGSPLVEVLRRLEQAGARVDGVSTRETSLEDVFIAIVGRALDDRARAPDGSGRVSAAHELVRAAEAPAERRAGDAISRSTSAPPWRAPTCASSGSFREPTWLLGDAVFPNVGMCAFVLLYRALGAPREFEALAVIGGVLSTYWINVLWGMGAQFYWEKQQGQLQLYFVAPCSRMAILTGMALGGALTTVLRSLVGIAIGFWVFHMRIAPVGLAELLGIFVLTLVALYALGMTLSSLFLFFGREAWHLCNAMTEPAYFLSGMYFPIRSLGALGATAAAILPLGLGVDAMRQALLGSAAHALLPLRLEIMALAVFAVLFFLLARLALDHLETLSKREGD